MSPVVGASSPSVTIGPYEPTDAAAVLALAALERFVLEPEAEARRRHAVFWVARTEHGAVAYLLALEVADEIELLQLVVDPRLRRRGVGRLLVDELLAFGRTRGARAVHLEVRASNGPAQALYEGAGFALEGRRRSYYADGDDALLLSAWLT
jgi:ribosomal-protein-alanine N-acetyltransferase